MFNITIIVPKHNGYLEVHEVRDRVISALANILPEDIRSRVWNEGYQEGYERGLEEGVQSGYDEAKVFKDVHQDAVKKRKKG